RAAGTRQAATPTESPAGPESHRHGPQRPAVARPLPRRGDAAGAASDPLRHQAVMSRIRRTHQDTATKLHGDASYTPLMHDPAPLTHEQTLISGRGVLRAPR